MKNTTIRFILVAIGLVFLASCATANKTKLVSDSMVKDLTPGFQSGDLVSNVDGLVILLDSSSSMAHTYQDYVKFDIAKAFVRRMNNTMPPISAISGLRTFGHAPELSRKQTQLFYGMAPYSRNELNKGVEAITPSGGPTPMTSALQGAGADLENIMGNKVIILISDGKDLTDAPLLAAQELQAKMGDTLCIYTVVVGDDEKGKVMMDEIAKTSSCGFMTLAQDLSSADPMADYVSDVFLTTVEKTVQVPASQEIGLGYHKAEPVIMDLGNVHFRFDDATLTKEGENILNQNIQVMMDDPDVEVVISGHTSAAGTKDHNQKLSERRASSVRDYLINVGKIQPSRLSIIGYGATKPLVPEPNPEQINSAAAKANMRVGFEVLEK
jgi:OOP family OmpA-OmpF porin